jgi:hypothetical protein
MKPEEIAKTVARGSVEARLKLYFEYLAAYNLSSGEEEILEPAQLQRIEANYKKHSGRSEVMELAAYFKAFTMLKDRLALYEAQLQYILIKAERGYSELYEATNRAILIEEVIKTANDPQQRREELLATHGRDLVLNSAGTLTPNYNYFIESITAPGKEAIEIANDAADLIALLQRVLKTELKVERLASYVVTTKERIIKALEQIDRRVEEAIYTIRNREQYNREQEESLEVMRRENSILYKNALEALLNFDAIEVTPEEVKQFKSLGQ